MILNSSNRFLIVAQSLILIGLTLAAAFLFSQGRSIPWITLAVIPVILGGWHYYEQMPKQVRWLYVAFLVILLISISVKILNSNSLMDFKHFWISARVALTGNNFYDPANLHAVLAQLDPSEAPEWFVTRLVDTGFWYPPMTILTFLPLGLFDLYTAWTINYVFLAIIFLITVWSIQKTFLPNSGLLGYTMLITFLLVLFPTGVILEVSQTNFMLMLLVLLFWHHRDRPVAGVWLGLAIVIKPFVAILFLFLLLRKYWRSIIYAGLTLGVLAGVTALLYGVDIFFSYKPTANIPLYVYSEPDNASLLAFILRVFDVHFDGQSSPIFHPLFLVSALVLTLMTLWIVYFLPKTKDRWTFSLLMMLSLMVYPTSLRHYGIFIVLPLLWIWTEKEDFPGGTIGALLFITLECTLLAYKLGYFTFYPILICWLGLVGLGLRHLYAPNLGNSALASIGQRLNIGRSQETTQ